MADDPTSKKRFRDEAGDSTAEAKRLCADLFLGILDDEEETGERDPGAEEVAAVMRFFEEEILCRKDYPPATAEQPSDPCRPDLGYLLEASDDEFGLPPASAVLSPGETEKVGFGQIWGLDDDVVSGLYGRRIDGAIFSDDVAFGGGGGGGAIFDYYSDDLFGVPDLSWRPESLPFI